MQHGCTNVVIVVFCLFTKIHVKGTVEAVRGPVGAILCVGVTETAVQTRRISVLNGTCIRFV